MVAMVGGRLVVGTYCFTTITPQLLMKVIKNHNWSQMIAFSWHKICFDTKLGEIHSNRKQSYFIIQLSNKIEERGIYGLKVKTVNKTMGCILVSQDTLNTNTSFLILIWHILKHIILKNTNQIKSESTIKKNKEYNYFLILMDLYCQS